jgi:hypothetical protein
MPRTDIFGQPHFATLQEYSGYSLLLRRHPTEYPSPPSGGKYFASTIISGGFFLGIG